MAKTVSKRKKLTSHHLDPEQVAAVSKFQREFNRPKYAEDESFSVTVLIYDEDWGIHYLGYFNFLEDKWHNLGDEELPETFWWCYPPIPFLHVKNKKRTKDEKVS